MMKIPVNLILGTLGAGKTTLVQNYLRNSPNSERITFIVNDFGELGVDALIAANTSHSNRIQLSVHPVQDGCLCCSARTGFILALMNVIEAEKPDRIFIEPTGLAQPEDLLQVLLLPEFRDKLSIRSPIIVVDGRVRPLPSVLFDGVPTVINFSGITKKIENGAGISTFKTEHSRVPLEIFERPMDGLTLSNVIEKIKLQKKQRAQMRMRVERADSYVETQRFDDHIVFASAKIRAWCVRGSVDLPKGLERCKGILNTDEGAKLFQLSVGGGQLSWELVDLQVSADAMGFFYGLNWIWNDSPKEISREIMDHFARLLQVSEPINGNRI